MISYANRGKVPRFLMLCNAEKAFDRVQWDFLECILVKMNFGLSFRKWVGMIYHRQEAEIHLGNVKSKPI